MNQLTDFLIYTLGTLLKFVADKKQDFRQYSKSR